MAWFSRKAPQEPGKLEFLRNYTLGQGTLDVLAEAPDPQVPMPAFWRSLHQQDPAARVAAATDAWTATVASELSNTIAYLRDHATDIEVIRLGNAHLLLYTVVNRQGLTQYYAGGNPSQPVFADDGSLLAHWPQVPPVLRNFYEQTHTGFFYFPARALGLESLEFIRAIDWMDIEFEPEVDLKATFPFFSNMMGDYVVVDVTDGQAALWWKDDPPDYGINFWDVIDEWTVIGFEPS